MLCLKCGVRSLTDGMLLHVVADVILFWFPFYFEIKIALLVWCMYPVEHNGSMVIYHKVLRPMFLKHEKKLDSAVKDAVKTAVSAATATAGAVGAPGTSARGCCRVRVCVDAVVYECAWVLLGT